MKKILIVEDEFSIAMDIESRLVKMGYNVIGIGDSFEEALELVTNEQPDLMLMDININGTKNGIETAETLQKICNAPVIFLTAYSEDKIFKKALETKPAGYLLKPFDERQLKTCIEVGLVKREELLQQQEEMAMLKTMLMNASQLKHVSKDQIFIKDKYKIIKLIFTDILRLEALDNYTQIYTSNGKSIVNLFLKDVLAHIDNSKFVRIHRSHVINIDKLEFIEGNVVKIGGVEVPIGRKYKPELLEHLDILN